MSRQLLFRKFKTSYFLIILTTLSIATRFYKIDTESLWLDEAFSFWISASHGSIKTVLNYISGSTIPWWDPHPFFYYLILHYWMQFIGSSELALRSLSAIASVLSILLTYHIGNRFFNLKVGVLASTLVLMNSLNLWYSQEARMYTLTGLLILLSIYFFLAIITAQKNLLNSIFFIISSTLLIYTDYLGLLIIIFQMLYVFFYIYLFKKHKITVFLWCYCILLLFYIPWLPVFYYMLHSWGGQHPMPPTILYGLKALLFYMVTAGVDDFQEVLLPHGSLKVIIGIVGMSCWIMSLLGGALSFRNRSDSGIFFTMICCIPITLFIISKTMVSIFCSKYISVFVPEMALLLAVGYAYSSDVLSKLKINVLHKLLMVSFILIVIINCYSGYFLYNTNTKHNWRDTTRYVGENMQQNDTIVLLNYAQQPFGYYMRFYPDMRSISFEELKTLSHIPERFWFVYSDIDKKLFEAEINQYLNDRSQEIFRKKFNGTNVIFYRTHF